MSDVAVPTLTPAEAVAVGAKSLGLYGQIFFQRTFRKPGAKYHPQMFADLYSTARYNAFAVHRDGAKTSILRVFTSQRVAYDISNTIMYVGSSQPHAIMSLRWLKRHVEHNTAWATTFGLRPGPKWTDEWLEVEQQLPDANGVVQRKLVTLLAMGITGQIRGFNPDDFRPDLIIGDDILTDENVKTKEQRDKISSLWFGALYNSLAPATESPLAKMVLLQTPLHRADLLAQCLSDSTWNGRVFSCFDENGESSWPERYPTATLLKEKASFARRGQLSVWMREKECKLVTGEQQCFNIDNLRYWQELPKGLLKIGATDPASSDNPKADKNASGVIGLKGPDVYVLAYKAAKAAMPDQAVNDIIELALRFPGIIRWAVEIIAYQRVLAWLLRQVMQARRVFFPIHEVQDRRRKNDRIVQALAGRLAYGHLIIHESMSELITELNDFNPDADDNQDDILDMLAMAIDASQPFGGAVLEGEASVEEVVLAEDDLAPDFAYVGGCP